MDPKAYVLIAIGIWAIFYGLNKSDPMLEDLMKVSGTLEKAEVYEDCNPRCSQYFILTIAGAPNRYWTHAIRPDQLDLLGGVGSSIEVYTARIQSYRPIDGNAVKSWGLTVNDRIIMQPEVSLIAENVVWQVVLPLMGGVVIFVGFIVGVIEYFWRDRDDWTKALLTKPEQDSK